MPGIQSKNLISSECWTYEYVADRLISTNWPELSGNWEDNYKELIAGRYFGAIPATGFDMLVFPALVWRLTRKYQLLGCLVFDNNNAEQTLGRKPNYAIRWEHQIDTSQLIRCAPSIWSSRFVKRKSGLFKLKSIDDLYNLIGGSYYSDATAEINLYALEEHEDPAQLLKEMNGRALPNEAKIKSICKAFIDIVSAQDLGYAYALMIRTNDISPEFIHSEIEDLNNRILNFKEQIKGCKTVSALLEIMQELVDPLAVDY